MSQIESKVLGSRPLSIRVIPDAPVGLTAYDVFKSAFIDADSAPRLGGADIDVLFRHVISNSVATFGVAVDSVTVDAIVDAAVAVDGDVSSALPKIEKALSALII